MRILVVDDDPLAGEMTAALLEFHGYESILAGDAMEAISQLDNADDIALIVSDMYMPLISGLDLLEMLREQHVSQPFILLTGDTSDKTLSQTPGLDACLQKNGDLESTLSQAVQHALSSASHAS